MNIGNSSFSGSYLGNAVTYNQKSGPQPQSELENAAMLAARRKAYNSGRYTFDSSNNFRPKTQQEIDRDMTPEEREAKRMKAINDETSRLNAMSGLRAAQERVRKDKEADAGRAYKERMDSMMADPNYMNSVEGREEAMRRGLITRPTPQQPRDFGGFIGDKRVEYDPRSVRATTGR